MLIRNVGHLMKKSIAVKYQDGKEVPEGIMDAFLLVVFLFTISLAMVHIKILKLKVSIS